MPETETPEVEETVESDGERLRLLPRDAGTRHLFGKPYHYARRDDDSLTLLPGPDPRALASRD